ncbi:MAG: diguanylate cyclase [Proteobacteria bacterium]|nr:diguanylate cyclase [Pseudomonadota bacterium]
MRFRSCQRAITLAIALAVAAYAPVALADDVAALLKRADAIKTSDNRTFQSILTQLDGEHASLTPQQRSYLQYLHAWQLAFSGDFAKAMPAFDAIIDSQQDATVRLRAGVTSVNLLTIASRNLEAYTRLSKVLDVLPQATDPDARAQALGVASMLFSQAGQYELGLSFANKYIAADPTSHGPCKGGALRVLALRQDKSVTLADQDFENTITACENIGEPIYAAITRSQAARYYLDHGRTQDAIAILRQHYEQTQATHYPATTSEVDAVLALAEEKAGDAEQARSYAQRAASEVPKNQSTEAAADAFGVLYRDAKHRGDAVAALDWHEKFAAADKGYLSDVSARALAYQQVHQQVAARKAEIAALNQQNQLLKLKREVDAKSLLAVRLGVALLLVLLGSLGLYALRTRRSQLKFQKLAQRDGLTEIHNRQYFIECAQAELRYCRKSLREASLISFDLDHFKQINDTHGHAAGDVALKAAVAACQKHLRSVDIFGRLGGEEFGILLPDTIPARAADIAEMMRAQIAALQGSDGGPAFAVTASFGIASARAAGYDLTQLLAQADDALYQAKRSGRDRVIAHGTVALVSDGPPPGVPERRHG